MEPVSPPPQAYWDESRLGPPLSSRTSQYDGFEPTNDDTIEHSTKPAFSARHVENFETDDVFEYLVKSASGEAPDPTLSSRQKPNSAKALLLTSCQALRLKLIYQLLAKYMKEELNEPVIEREKTVYSQSRAQAFARCLIHILPVTAGVVLIFFNTWQYYIGGELAGWEGQDAQKLAGLQFASKLEELLILASLGTILWSYIRREIIMSGSGIPLGALFAGHSYDSLSFLWSLEFWGVILQAWYKGPKKWVLIILIVVCCLLGTSLGPATAILMIPRLAYWPAGGTTFWIATTSDALFPSVVNDSLAVDVNCLVDTWNVSCPHGGWQGLRELMAYWPRLSGYAGTMPDVAYLASPYSYRQLVPTTRNPIELYRHPWTISTVPGAPIADGLTEVARLWAIAAANTERNKRFMYRKDVQFIVETYQPAVMTRCFSANMTEPYDTMTIGFPKLDSTIADGNQLDQFEVIRDYDGNTRAAMFDSMFEAFLTGVPQLLFIDDPYLMEQAQSSIAVLATFPTTSADSSQLYSCSIDSRWAATELTAMRNLLKYVLCSVDIGAFSGRRFMIGSDWARYLNPVVTVANDTLTNVFAELSSAAGVWNATLATDEVLFEVIVEYMISNMLASGLSRLSYGTYLAGGLTLDAQDTTDPHLGFDFGQWGYELLPKARLGPGGNAFTLTPDEQEASTQFTMAAYVNGYAYSSGSKTTKAAIAVMLTYMLLAMCHVAYALITGWTTTAWDTDPEITMLGLSSGRSPLLGKTGVGVTTSMPFEQRVRIRMKDKRVQMVFDDTHAGTRVLVEEKQYA